MVIAAGTVVWVQNDGTVAPADAGTDPNRLAGIATQPGTSAGPMNVMTFGILDVYSGLVAGTQYWMDQSNGQPTVTMPTSGLILQMGIAVSATALSLQLQIFAPVKFLSRQLLAALTATRVLASVLASDDMTYRVGGWIAITVIGSATMKFTVAWVDQNSNSQSVDLVSINGSVSVLNAANFYPFSPVDVRVGGGQTLTITATKASGSGLVYQGEAYIQGL